MEHEITQFRKWIRVNAQNGVFYVKNNDGAALTATINQAKGYATIRTVTGIGVNIADGSGTDNWQVFKTLVEVQAFIAREQHLMDVLSDCIERGVEDDCQ